MTTTYTQLGDVTTWWDEHGLLADKPDLCNRMITEFRTSAGEAEG